MDEILDLNILTEGINYDPDIKEFKEFCNDLNILGSIVNPELYIEAMVDNNKSWLGAISIKKPLKNTRETTKDIKKAYGDLTDGGGTLIRSIWDMSMKGIQFTSRILKFVLLNLAKIPKMIVGVAQTIGKIPQNVKNKIRGNVQLYITVNDVDNLYKKLIPTIDSFLRIASDMSKGDMWGTFFNRRAAGEGIPSKYIMTENDMAYYRKMKSVYGKLKLIDFKETVVKFESQNVIDIYFGGLKSIKYTDANNKTNQSNYYDALVHIFNDVREQEDFLKRVQTDMGQKFDKSQMNQSFGRLSEPAQKIVGESIQMISKVINIIGNLIRYVTIDIKTLRNSASKILKKNDVARVKNESVDFFGESYDDLYQECVGLFEERSAKVDKRTLRSLTPEEKKIVDERFGEISCSIMWNKHGYFATTHRARSDYYDTLEKLPKAKVAFVSSTS
jgi:hypothetical protein